MMQPPPTGHPPEWLQPDEPVEPNDRPNETRPDAADVAEESGRCCLWSVLGLLFPWSAAAVAAYLVFMS